MENESGARIMMRALDFLHAVKTPVSVSSYLKLNAVGDAAIDKLLAQISLLMLTQLKSDGMIEADDLSGSDARIYGLTAEGVRMRDRFRQIVGG